MSIYEECNKKFIKKKGGRDFMLQNEICFDPRIGDMEQLGTNPRTLTTTLAERGLNVKDFGAKGDGVTDDSEAFEQALAIGVPLFVPFGEYIITKTLFPKNSIIGVGLPRIFRINNDGTFNGRLFWLKSYQGNNIQISGLHLKSDWNGTNTEREHGHAITLGGCQNVTIENCVIDGFYGDGICIARGGDTHQGTPYYSENIKVINNKIRNCYRGCVTLISVDKVYIEKNSLSKNIAYQAIIACESNTSLVERISNVFIENNQATGPDNFCRMYQANGAASTRYKNIHLLKNNVKARRLFAATGSTIGIGNISDIYIQDNHFEVHEKAELPTHFCDIYNHCKENVYIINNVSNGGGLIVRDINHVQIANNSIVNANITNFRCNYMNFEGNEIKNGGSYTSDGAFQNFGAANIQGPFIINNKFVNCTRGIGLKNHKINYAVFRDNHFDCSEIAIDLGLTSAVTDSNIHLYNNNFVNTPTKIRNNQRLKYITENLSQTVARKPFTFSNTTPSSGSWHRGEIVFNVNPSALGHIGWVCIESGSPGKWRGFGLIAE